MTKYIFCVAVTLALLFGSDAAAQTFPEPGTGAFTWERVGSRPLDIESFSFSPDGHLFAARDSVWVLDLSALGAPTGRWVRLGRPGGITAAVLALSLAGDTLLVGVGGGATLRSVNSGATWAIVNGDFSGTVAGGPDKPDGFFVLPRGHARAGRLLAGGVAIYSDDRGALWREAAQDIPLGQQSYARTFAALPSGRVLAGTMSGVIASDDAGTSYLRTPLWGTFVVSALAPFATPGSSQAGTPSCGVAGGALCDGALAVGYSSQLPDVRAWRTNDGGRSWSESVALPEPYDGVGNGLVAGVVVLAPGPDGLGRAITVLGRGVVYATRNGGQTWAAVGRLPVFDIGHSTRQVRLGPDGRLWVSTSMNGVAREWMYRSAERAEAAFPVTGDAGPGEAPEVGVSVRPNPARGQVEVALKLAEAAPVRVVIVDALGREVAVVLDGSVPAGERAVSVGTGSWPAGVYVVRASAAGRESTARFTVVR